jgi:hypothetical protein
MRGVRRGVAFHAIVRARILEEFSEDDEKQHEPEDDDLLAGHEASGQE